MRSPALLATASLVFVAACGARSSLRDFGATTGGGNASTTAGTTGSGGSGGGPSLFCSSLVAIEPRVELPARIGATAARDPLLQLLFKGVVVALVRSEMSNAKGKLPGTIDAFRLEPWGAWPPVAPPAVRVSDSVADSTFVAGVEYLGPGTFDVSFDQFSAIEANGCAFTALYGVLPEATLSGDAVVGAVTTGQVPCGDLPLSVATADDGSFFFAVDLILANSGPSSRTLIAQFIGSGPDGATLLEPACASTHFVADVLTDAAGFHLVHSTSGPCGTGGAGVANRLVLHRIEAGNDQSAVVYEGVDDLVFARLLPRQGGNWLIYRESGASALVQPPGMALQLGADGAPGASFAVTDAGTDRLAAAPFGDGFAVAFVDSLDPSAKTILVRVYSAQGTLRAQTSFSTGGALLNGDRLTLTPSPDATSLLVGWTGQGSNPAMFLRRFDCSPAVDP
jgi:hypothetical protein